MEMGHLFILSSIFSSHPLFRFIFNLKIFFRSSWMMWRQLVSIIHQVYLTAIGSLTLTVFLFFHYAHTLLLLSTTKFIQLCLPCTILHYEIQLDWFHQNKWLEVDADDNDTKGYLEHECWNTIIPGFHITAITLSLHVTHAYRNQF